MRVPDRRCRWRCGSIMVNMQPIRFLIWPLCALKHLGLLFWAVVGGIYTSADPPAFPLFNIPIGNSQTLLPNITAPRLPAIRMPKGKVCGVGNAHTFYYGRWDVPISVTCPNHTPILVRRDFKDGHQKLKCLKEMGVQKYMRSKYANHSRLHSQHHLGGGKSILPSNEQEHLHAHEMFIQTPIFWS